MQQTRDTVNVADAVDLIDLRLGEDIEHSGQWMQLMVWGCRTVYYSHIRSNSISFI